MSFRITTIAFTSAALFLTGCGKKSASELAEEERNKLREVKRQNAAKYYRLLAEKYPEHEKAGEAARKAADLEAKAPKK
jgi:hypothetical protein